MNNTLFIFMLIAEVFYFVIIFFFLKKKTLSLQYTLLWIIAGVFMVLFTSIPSLLRRLMVIFNIQSMMNGVFALCIFFMVILLMSLTSICSKQSDKLRTLTQENAILEKRIRDIEDKLEK